MCTILYLQREHCDECGEGAVVGDDDRVLVEAARQPSVVSDHVHLGATSLHL